MLNMPEVLIQSDKSWEDAAQNTVNQASEMARGIKSIYVEEMEASTKTRQDRTADQGQRRADFAL